MERVDCKCHKMMQIEGKNLILTAPCKLNKIEEKSTALNDPAFSDKDGYQFMNKTCQLQSNKTTVCPQSNTSKERSKISRRTGISTNGDLFS